ncbi:hypothetical protein [Salinibaculum rarum]|uniref:hypothetical protein n=1 Tax=Salinibaculum rarum TaxID=3058903 RepID=UPI00265DA38D|nr:hypothetical protein [Salinibaculum sp. KK48]
MTEDHPDDSPAAQFLNALPDGWEYTNRYYRTYEHENAYIIVQTTAPSNPDNDAAPADSTEIEEILTGDRSEGSLEVERTGYDEWKYDVYGSAYPNDPENEIPIDPYLGTRLSLEDAQTVVTAIMRKINSHSLDDLSKEDFRHIGDISTE